VLEQHAYVEALFRTGKYVPSDPKRGFGSLEAARKWVHEANPLIP